MINIANDQFEIYTLGIAALHQPAFSKMVEFGHRVVSVKKLTPSKFLIKTECIHDKNKCKGSMHFELKNTEINLWLAEFTHNIPCTLNNGTQNSKTIEDITSNRGDWSTVLKKTKKRIENNIAILSQHLDESEKPGNITSSATLNIGQLNLHYEYLNNLENMFEIFEG